MIKAVIFDMDGLLIDSEPFWRMSHQTVLASYGHAITEDDVRAAAGKRTLDQVAVWKQRFGFTEPSNEAMASQIVDSVIAAVHEKGAPMAGVDDLIKDLHERGVPMAVASSSSPRLINVVLERLGILAYMQAIHSGEHEARGKPFPDVFLSTARTLGVHPADCLVFEDSLNGVKAAKAAGMKCIAIPEEPYEATVFKSAGADRVLKSLQVVRWQDVRSL